MKRTLSSKLEETELLIRERGLVRARELSARGLPLSYLRRLEKRGLIEKLGPGLYVDAAFQPSENHSFAEATKRVPQGVICLLSALRFHGLTTQAPFQVWIAIEVHAWRTKQQSPPMRVVHMGESALLSGIESHSIAGVQVKVFGPAKTVADCFKYRNKIGLDVALEALKAYRESISWNHDELWRMAHICRVANVMRPYLEALA